MKDNFIQMCFQVHCSDNVATALDELKPGVARVNGDSMEGQVEVLEKIPRGHKIAIKDISKGEKIIKYGITIGVATQDIKKGFWVHLHNMKSQYDERSSKLDFVKGALTDTKYD